MLQIKALLETDPQWEQVCAYAVACSWKAGDVYQRQHKYFPLGFIALCADEEPLRTGV